MSKTPKRYENFRVFRYFCLFSGSKNFDHKRIILITKEYEKDESFLK